MIRLEHITKKFSHSTPLNDLSVTINDGDVISIIGASGSGKSTLLRTINLLERPTSGKIFLDDDEITRPDYRIEEARKKMAMVFQSYNLFNHLSVLENLVKPQVDILGKDEEEAREHAIKTLKSVGLRKQHNLDVSILSGGQKQRVAIARALVMDPEVILFDEPTNALDHKMAKEITSIINDLKKLNKTMIIVTHNLELAESVSTRIFYMDQGTIYEDDTPEVIFHNPKRSRTKAFIDNLSVLKISFHDDYDMEKANKEIESFADQLKLSKRSAYKLQMVFDELIYELMVKNLEIEDMRIIAGYSATKDRFNFDIKYNGRDISEDDLLETLLSPIIKDFKCEESDDDKYLKRISFLS